MPSTIVFSVAASAAIYVFLQALAYLTKDPRQPKAIVGTIPFISPLIGMLIEKQGFYIRMRDEHGLPIYTLRVPGPPIYVVNSLPMIQRIDRHIMTVAFSPIQSRVCDKVTQVSSTGMAIIGGKELTEDGYLRSFSRSTSTGFSPGPGLDALNRSAVDCFAASLDRLAAKGRTTVKLYHWLRHELFASTMDATYGPHNPFRDSKVEEAWFDFESGIMTVLLDVFPNVFARQTLKTRELMLERFQRYFQDNHHLDGSLLVQLRHKHNAAFGLDTNDIAHTEIGQVAGGIVNTAPTAFWLVWQVLADPVVFKDCSREVRKLVQTDPQGIKHIDLAQVRTACPILVSTWQEILRFHGISTAARIIKEDTWVDDQYLLKKGGVVLMPNGVVHSDQAIWGPTANVFNHKRFLKGAKDTKTRFPAAAFRGFGGGHVLCPGRHFASTEVLALLALILVRFDVRPVGGVWVEPKKNNAMDRACPLPRQDVEVELVSKSDEKWHVVFSETKEGINIVAEDQGDE